jgi:hypothetical protein
VVFAYFTEEKSGKMYRNTLCNRRSTLNASKISGNLIARVQNESLFLSTDGLILQLKISTKQGEIVLTDNFIDLREN